MSTTIIASSGTKGLLQWIKASNPGFYAYLSPKLIASAKGMAGLDCMPPGMGRMGDAYSSYVSSAYASYAGVPAPTIQSVSVDAGANPGFSDLTIAPSTTDAISASSSSPTSSALATTISALANGYSSATLTAAQVSANNTLLQTNLLRAQQGLPPLTASTLSTGLTSLTSNSGLLLLGVAAAALLLMGGKKAA
jgi:hypothetical protein